LTRVLESKSNGENRDLTGVFDELLLLRDREVDGAGSTASSLVKMGVFSKLTREEDLGHRERLGLIKVAWAKLISKSG
jgi:hypothetical protein